MPLSTILLSKVLLGVIFMVKVVLLGGNGYLGRNFVEEWVRHEQEPVKFYVLSKSGHNQLHSDSVVNIKVDVDDEGEVFQVLPDQFDYIVDFIGAPNNDPEIFDQLNYQPAKVMKDVAEKYNCKAMGFVGGVLGPKQFTNAKKEIIADLQQSRVPLAYVEPTLVYGAGRKDKMTRNVPLLKFLGLFSKKFKPVLVDDVVNELRHKLLNE